MLLPVALQVPSKIVMHQLMLMGLFIALGALGWGSHNGLSLLVGGLCAWMPTRLVTRMVFSIFPTPRTFLALFFAGEIIRMLLSSVFFILAIRYLPVTVLPVLVGFVLAAVAFRLSSVFVAGRQA